MSDNIPFEVQVEIVKKLPVKSLLQFRSVSKAWKCLIDSSHFVSHYGCQVQHLLVNYHHYLRDDHKYVSIVDDDTFPHHKVSPIVPLFVRMLINCSIIGSSHGLLCLNGMYCDDQFPGTLMAVVWNVSIKKAVAVVVPYRGSHGGIYDMVLGFGVCPETNDPKIVKIRQAYSGREEKILSCIRWQVEVFTLSTGAWRSLHSNLPRTSIKLYRSQVVIDEFLYWLATDNITKDGNLIMSFDLTREVFREINLSDTLGHHPPLHNLYLSKLRESLVVLEHDGSENNKYFVVWMMEDGISKSFTKLFTICTPDATILGVLAFRNSGEPIIEIAEHGQYLNYDSSLVVYEPYSKHIKTIGFDGTNLEFSMSSYTETLLLLDQPNFVVYDKDKWYILKQRVKTRRLSKRKVRN